MIEFVPSEWQNIFGRMLLWGIIILLFFVPARIVLPYVVRKKTTIDQRKDQLKLLQLIVWIFYFSWFLFLFAEIRSIFSIVVAAVLLGLLYLVYRFWLADVVAGVLFRNQYALNVGDIIYFGDVTGKIVSIDSRFIQVETQEGYSVYLTYTTLQSGIFMKSESKVLSTGYTFDVTAASDDPFPALAARVRDTLITLPWVSLRKEPVITQKGYKGGKRVITISVSAVDRSFTPRIEQYVRKEFE